MNLLIPVDRRAEVGRRSAPWLCGLLSVGWLIAGSGNSAWSAATSDSQAEADAATEEPIVPIPLVDTENPATAALGERLFHDAQLSRNRLTSCVTCHQLDRGGTDGLPIAKMGDGTLMSRNTTTVFNVGLNYLYNWDGSAADLEIQPERLLLNPSATNMTWSELLARLGADPEYATAFRNLFPDGITPANVLAALASYERTLTTPNSRFDQYLRGRREALTEKERQGYRLFKSYGCVACHQGMNVGGNMFQRFGIFPYSRALADGGKSAGPTDLGRFQVTQVERDRHVFRVPSLRNVALTAPYFHDGQAATLESAVDTMAQVQLGKTLTPEEIGLIVSFLRTLTGEYRGQPLAAPVPDAPE